MLSEYYLKINRVLYDNNFHFNIIEASRSKFTETHINDYFFKKINTRDLNKIQLIISKRKNKNKSFKTIKEALKYFELFEHLL
jgi:hypothetical protein